MRIHYSFSVLLSKMIRCDASQKLFTSKRTLYQHIRQKYNKKPTLNLRIFVCGHCNQNLSSSFNLLRHLRNIHNLTGNFNCLSCYVLFGFAELLENHENKFKPPRLLFLNALCPITTCQLIVFKLRSMILSRFSDQTWNE